MDSYSVDPNTGDVMIVSDAPLTPDVAPPPDVTTSNNWGSSLSGVLQSIVQAGGSAVNARIVQSTVQNRPPNSSGKNMQALSTPGGTVQPFNAQVLKQNAGALIALALVAVALVAFMRK